MKTNATVLVPDELIVMQIWVIGNQKVMADRDLAKLFEVERKSRNKL